MAYQFVSQMRGPVINENLFAENYGAGVRVGDATNPYKQAVDGLFKGIEQGQTIAANQHTLDRLPVKDAIEDENLKQEIQNTELQDLELRVAQDTEEEFKAAKKAELTEKAVRSDANKALREKQNQFLEAYQNAATPELKKQVIFSGQYNDVFAANPRLYSQSISAPDVWRTLNSEEQEGVSLNLGRRQVKDSIQALAEKERPAFLKSQALWADSPVRKSLSVSTGINDPDDVASKIEIVPKGYYVTDDVTGQLKTNIKGRPGANNFMVNPSVDYSEKMYDAVYNGKVIQSNIHEDEKKKYDNYKTNKTLQDGTFLREKLDRLDAGAAKRRSQTQQTVQQSSDTSPEVKKRETSFNQTPLSQEFTESQGADPDVSRAEAQMMLAFNIPRQEISTFKEPLEQLSRTAKEYVRNASARNSTALQLSKDLVINDMADTVASREFEKSSMLKDKYTPEKVREYNSLVDSDLAGLSSFGLQNALKVSDPKGLYYKDRKPALLIQFNNFFNQMLLEEQKKVESVRVKPDANRQRNDFLTSIRARP